MTSWDFTCNKCFPTLTIFCWSWFTEYRRAMIICSVNRGGGEVSIPGCHLCHGIRVQMGLTLYTIWPILRLKDNAKIWRTDYMPCSSYATLLPSVQWGKLSCHFFWGKTQLSIYLTLPMQWSQDVGYVDWGISFCPLPWDSKCLPKCNFAGNCMMLTQDAISKASDISNICCVAQLNI